MGSVSKGTFVWYEHLTSNAEEAIAFYSDVAGWKTQPFTADYTMWVGSQGPLGGVMRLQGEAAKDGTRPQWMAHVEVEDVDATAALARQLGGKIWHEPTQIPDVGRFAVIADPQGAVVALFRPEHAMAAHEPDRDGEFCWSELLTTDATAAFQFYAALFGWKVLQEMDMGAMGTYRIFGNGDRRLGGMMNLPKGSPMPTTWLYYLSTSDLGAAVDRAKRRGGKLLAGPMDVPGGRISQLADPQGALFALHQASPP